MPESVFSLSSSHPTFARYPLQLAHPDRHKGAYDVDVTRFVLLLLGIALPALCQNPIRYEPGSKLWLLNAGAASYVMGVNDRNELQHVYWGPALWRAEDLASAHSARDWASFDPSPTVTTDEYPGWGSARYIEPCLKVTLEDGVRDLVLKYVSHEIRDSTLTVRLKDVNYDLRVNLIYHVYPKYGMIERHSVIENATRQRITVESAQSAVWYVPQGDGYRLTHLSGRWAGETQLNQEPIQPGTKLIESRRGNTSHQANPWFAIDSGARQEDGRVWFGALGWSGSWKFSIEQTPHQQVRVTGGLHTFDFAYSLQPGESLETPAFYGGFTTGGFGEASRLLHQLELNEILPRSSAGRPRPVLYNSWEATTFDVDEPGQKALAEKAARIGVERFVMDDGWFGARNNDRAGLGDWQVNPRKFPNGLKPLIDHVKSLGMDFGLWVEPEMINPDSDLYRQHPDWAMHFPGRPRTEARHQLVLNMARDDVKEHIFTVLDRLLSENDIRFLKWDMNRNFAEPGWPEAPIAEQKELWVKYTRNVYEIIDRLRARHANLEIESCSGGGGRVDLGILRRVEEVWPSDNTDAYDRLRIQEGFTYAYTPKVMMAWVTDVPNFNGRSTPLKFRFLTAMMGSLGIGANLNKWSAEDFDVATKMVAWYKTVRTTIQEGRLYRLLSPRDSDVTANEYVSADGKQAVLFVLLRSQQFGRPLPALSFRGLDSKALYRVKSIDGRIAGKQETLSGAFLQGHGLTFPLRGDYDSSAVVLERVD